MLKRFSSDQWLGLIFCAAALLLLFVWIPLDVDTGLIEKVRRQVRLGDSLAPVIAGVVIVLGASLCVLRPNPGADRLTSDNLRWVAMLLGIVAASLLTMRYVGPFLVDLVAEPSYRTLRATPPWNYVGYVLGGTVLTAGLISVIRGRLSPGAILLGLVASLVIAMLYDLPFEDLQLPPNGDV